MIHWRIDWCVDWLYGPWLDSSIHRLAHWAIRRFIECCVDWFVNWPIDWIISGRIDRPIAWFVDSLVDWLIDRLIDWFIHSFIHTFGVHSLIRWLIHSLSHSPIESSIGRFVGWFIRWLCEWFVDSLIDALIGAFNFWSIATSPLCASSRFPPSTWIIFCKSVYIEFGICSFLLLLSSFSVSLYSTSCDIFPPRRKALLGHPLKRPPVCQFHFWIGCNYFSISLEFPDSP